MIKQLLTAMLAAQIVLGIAPAKVQAEDISAVNALTTDSASSIAESVADGQGQNRVNTGPHVFAAVTASGTWGTCSWSLSSDGVLTIGAGTGQNTFGTSNVPWYGQRANIKSVNLTGEVKLPQSARCLFADCTKLVEITGSGYFDGTRENGRCTRWHMVCPAKAGVCGVEYCIEREWGNIQAW